MSTAKTSRARPVAVASKDKRQPLAKKQTKDAAMVSVTFGHVSVSVTKPTKQTIQSGLTASKRVTKGLRESLSKPGVNISWASNIPSFRADPNNPQRVVRKLNGVSETGRFIKGEFRVDHTVT